MIEPLFDRVVVRVHDADDVSEGGIIIPDNAKDKPQEATVVAIGPDVKCVDVDNVIYFSKYAGTEFKVGDEVVLLLREEDIFARA